MHATTYRFHSTVTPLIREAIRIAQRVQQQIPLKSHRKPATFLVGGAVRDLVVHIPPKDVDIEIYHLSFKQLDRLLRHIYGKEVKNNNYFGTWEILTPAGLLNISMPRTEIYRGLHHTDVTITLDPYLPFSKALARRDFTMNAILVNLLTGAVHDPYHGSQDLQTRTLRVVKTKTFRHDALRAWRAMQFVARYKLTPDKTLIQLLRRMAHSPAMALLSRERILAESNKLCMPHSTPSLGLELAHTTGLLHSRVPSLTRLATQAKTWQKLKNTIDTLVSHTHSPAIFWQTILKALSETERSALIQELMLPKKYRLPKTLYNQKRTG